MAESVGAAVYGWAVWQNGASTLDSRSDASALQIQQINGDTLVRLTLTILIYLAAVIMTVVLGLPD